MENYTLQSNEAVLYKGEATYGSNKIYSELILTNLNLVIITKTKKIFSPEQIESVSFPVEEIKIYNDVPQVKQNDYTVEIYLSNIELKLKFYSKSLANKFVKAINELVTGKSISKRKAEKVKGAINLVDDTLGISTVGTIKSVVENGVVGTVLGGFGKKAHTQVKGRDTVTEVLSVTKGLIGKKTNEEERPMSQSSSAMSVEVQIETLKKLKDLLDAGVITQEEFDIKKKEIMGL